MRRKLGLALAVSLALGVTACAGGGDSAGGSDGDTIPLGFVYEGGGGFNNLSLAFVHGIQVAVDEANKAGGVTVGGKTYTFAVDTCNDHFDQTQTTGCANKLVLDNGDKFMFGGLADFGPILRGVTERKKVIYFSTGTAVASLMGSSKFVVNAVPTDEVRAETDVAAIQKLYPDAKRVAFLGDQTLTWEKDIQYIGDVIKKKTDLQIVATETAPATITDYSSFLTRVKASNPDVLVSYMSTPAKSKALLEANARLKAVPAYFNPAGTCEGINAGDTGIPIAANLNIGAVLTGPEVNDLVKKYISDFYANGYSPNPDPNISIALYTYDMVGWLKQAIEKAGTQTDTTKILAAMNSIVYKGVNGDIPMKDNQTTYGQAMCHSTTGAAPFDQTLIPATP
jgi:branched-chain amino acid transport system substrate-binding protein